MQSSFREDQTTRLSGGTIHECFRFPFKEGGNATIGNNKVGFNPDLQEPTYIATDILITILCTVLFKYGTEFSVFHQGTDGVSFDSVGVETEDGDRYICLFADPLYMHGEEWESTTDCYVQ